MSCSTVTAEGDLPAQASATAPCATHQPCMTQSRSSLSLDSPWQRIVATFWLCGVTCGGNSFPVAQGVEKALKRDFCSAQCLGTLESPPHLELLGKHFWLKYRAASGE